MNLVEAIKVPEQEKLLEELKIMEKLKEDLEETERKILNKREEITNRESKNKIPNLFSRIFKTKRFKNYLLEEKSLSTLKEELEQLTKQKKELSEHLQEYYNKRDQYEDRKETLESIKTISDLIHIGREYSFKDIIKFSKELGIPMLLTEKDMKWIMNEREKVQHTESFINNKDFKSLSDIIAVHKTDYPPKGEKIQSRLSGKVLQKGSIILGGEKNEFSYHSSRDTVHFSANHEVRPNNGGDWSEMKYAVLIPFEDLAKGSNIASARAVDMYTKGAAKLTSNSYILCPKGEGIEIQRNNSNLTVIEYEGENVKGYADALIMYLGYKLEIGHDHGFVDERQGNIYSDLVRNAGFSTYKHFESPEEREQYELGTIYKTTGVIKLIKEKQLLDKIGREQLISELEEQYDLDEFRFTFLSEEYSDVLLEELQTIGLNINLKEMHKKIFEEHWNFDAATNYILNKVFDQMEVKEIRAEIEEEIK